METKHNLLIVEDEKAISNLIATTLETQGYHYEKASNGAQAMLAVTSHSPEVILLDLGLPDMDGLDIIRKVRSWSSVPIIVISARTEDQDKIEALDAGADDYLTKPFSVEELLARLRSTFRRISYMQSEQGEISTVFVNGDLKIDLPRRQLIWANRSCTCLPSNTSFSVSWPEMWERFLRIST